ncbi:hypothetical protein NG798_16985 [Ancylothrix sp. C2]|uniref:hypothetical protein n=1 Tax=Ancylothrix sp. D3o TaxID=2953691 RepID=UPI0021BA52EE|nr:hypothetical protein [Ancylothrix sp. D3o]MCT7951500.1 hypothetical protein [Ancylothrix sp. D3o]
MAVVTDMVGLKALKFSKYGAWVKFVNKQKLLQISGTMVAGCRQFFLSRGAGVVGVAA